MKLINSILLGLVLALAGLPFANLLAQETPEADKMHSIRMHSAVSKGDLGAVKALVEAGASVDSPHIKGKGTPLFRASEAGDVDMVRFLLEKGADASSTNNSRKMAPIHIASQLGRKQIVRALFEGEADLNQPDWLGKTALHYAVQGKQRGLVGFLISAGANAEAQTRPGLNVLHSAVTSKSTDMVRFLVSRIESMGINKTEFIHKRTKPSVALPIHYAARQGNTEMTLFLVEEGGLPPEEDPENSEFMRNAIQGGSVPLVEFLMDKDFSLNVTDKTEGNAFHLVSMRRTNSKELVDLLLKNVPKERLNEPNKKGHVPLYVAILYVNANSLEGFLGAGADLALVSGTFHGLPPLHHVIKQYSAEAVQILANQKAIDLDLKDKDGKTALDHAKVVAAHKGYPGLGQRMLDALEAARTSKAQE